MLMRNFLVLPAAVLMAIGASSAQDSPSPADAARQARQQKQQQTPSQTGASDATPKSPHVITNDDLPEGASSSDSPKASTAPGDSNPLPNYAAGKQPAKYWRSQILQLKNSIASLQRKIDTVTNSVRFAG